MKTTGKEYEKVVAEDSVVEEPSWLPDGTARDIPYNYSFTKATAVTVGTNIYLLSSDNKNYKYDTLTNTYMQMTDIPYNDSNKSVAIGTDIYIIGGDIDGNRKLAYKYNTLTDTYTQLANIPVEFNGIVVAVGTDIYLLGGRDPYSGSLSYKNYNYKYDTLTDTYTKMTNIPYVFQYGATVAIGTDIYLFGGVSTLTNAYKYNTLTDTYTQLTNIPYSFSYGSAVVISNDVYLFGGNQNTTARVTCYKYDTLTDTYTQITNIPYAFYNGSATLETDRIYLFGGGSYPTKVQVLAFPSSEFDDKSIVLLNGSTYKTQLLSNNLFDSSVKNSFSDVWLYEDGTGLLTDIPTYYGNGTQWINIKNPPVEEVEE